VTPDAGPRHPEGDGGATPWLERYEDTRGFSLLCPTGWERLPIPSGAETAFVAIAPGHGGDFHANIVLTVDDLPQDLDVADWQAEVEPALDLTLEEYMLLDLERIDGPDGSMIRRLMHHVGPRSQPITAEQWARAHGPTGYTLTCSVATPAYDGLADLLADVGRSLRFTP